MANICDFSMFVIGEKDNIEKLYDALNQEGNIWIGRGVADADILIEVYSNQHHSAVINGWCKWSVQSALIDNAISMRSGNRRWSFGNVDVSKLEFITLKEASEKWNLVIEVYSAEDGIGFQEHYVFDNGVVVVDECVDWRAGWDISDYDSRRDFEEDYDIEITDEEWEDRYIQESGGFGEWEFGLWMGW